MENIYTAYTRMVNNVNFYFVKRYTVFSEYEGMPKVLNDLGMHTDFYRACYIAKIYDEAIVTQLLDELQIAPETAKVVSMNGVKAITHSLIKNTHQAILKLKLAGIN